MQIEWNWAGHEIHSSAEKGLKCFPESPFSFHVFFFSIIMHSCDSLGYISAFKRSLSSIWYSIMLHSIEITFHCLQVSRMCRIHLLYRQALHSCLHSIISCSLNTTWLFPDWYTPLQRQHNRCAGPPQSSRVGVWSYSAREVATIFLLLFVSHDSQEHQPHPSKCL